MNPDRSTWNPRSMAGLAFLILGLHVNPIAADIVHDHGGYWRQILYYSPVGQTFTAVDPTVHTIGFGILSMNDGDHALSIFVHEGEGIDGPLVGGVELVDFPVGPFGWVDFEFSPVLTVEVGEVYTIHIVSDTIRWGVESRAPGQYPDGYAFYHGEPTIGDLRFRVFSEERPGACCVDEGCLQDVDADACVNDWSGVHSGLGSYCSDDVCLPGACCEPEWGDCTETFHVECFGGGRFQGRGVRCAEAECVSASGACCVGDACEQYVRLDECIDAGGLWLGPGAYCDQHACPGCWAGDFDHDGDVDLYDMALLQVCYADDGGADHCRCGDVDARDAVAQADFAVLVDFLTGP